MKNYISECIGFCNISLRDRHAQNGTTTPLLNQVILTLLTESYVYFRLSDTEQTAISHLAALDMVLVLVLPFCHARLVFLVMYLVTLYLLLDRICNCGKPYLYVSLFIRIKNFLDGPRMISLSIHTSESLMYLWDPGKQQ